MSKLKALTHRKLFLPIVSMILVMLINVIYDTATGSAPFSFFYITVKNGVLYGRLIDVLNRGSEIAILAIGQRRPEPIFPSARSWRSIPRSAA